MSASGQSPDHEVEIITEENGTEEESFQNSKKATVYRHFTLRTDKDYFNCNYCTESVKKDKTGSTSGLRKHIQRKHKNIDLDRCSDAKQQKLDLFVKQTSKKFDPETFDDLLLKFVVATNQPFVIVNSPEFREFASYSRNEVKIPKNDALKSRCMERYEKEKSIIIEKLQNAPGKIGIILDCWTSKNYVSFQGIIACWISSNWSYEEVLLDLDILESNHSGKNLALSLVKVLNEFKILNRVVAITADNASNCDTLVEEFQRLTDAQGITFVAKDQRVRCLAHIVNLACQDGLKIFKRSASKPIQGSSELHAELEDSLGENVEDSCDEFSDDLGFSEDDNADNNPTIDPQINSVYEKVRNAIAKIRTSAKLRAGFKHACKIESLKPKMLSLDVTTRWNSTYTMLKRVHEMRKAFEAVLRGNPNLSSHMLSQPEWDLIEAMLKLLKPFYVTLMLSKSKIPTMSLTAAVYIKLYNHLETYTEQNCHSDILNAAKSACTKLNKYYPSSDSLVYIMGLVLDPRCKLQWYKIVGIGRDVIHLNKQTALRCWNKDYAEKQVAPVQNPSNTIYDLIASQMNNSVPSKPDEFKTYLSSPVADANSVNDVLTWWKDHQHEYPNVSRMARDFLAIYGTGVPIERSFSFGSDLLTPKSLSLNADTIRKRFCLKAWLSTSSKSFVVQKMKSIATKMTGC